MNHELTVGDKYPFDSDECEGNAPAARNWQHRAARGILADLCDRRGIKQGLNGIDLDIRKEIVEKHIKIINDALKEASGE